MAVILALVLTGCGGGGDSESSTATTTTTTTTTTTSTTESSTKSTVADDARCESDDPTSLSADWVTHESDSGSFAFSYPGAWEDGSGGTVVRARELVSRKTLDEAGIDIDEEFVPDNVHDPANRVTLSVTSLDGVKEPLDVVYDRQEAQTAKVRALERMLDTEIKGCIDGEPALGFDFLFRAPRRDTGVEATFYQRNWVVLHGSALHLVQLLSLEKADGRIVDEALRTWQWPDAGGDAASEARFDEVHMAANVDTSGDEPDPSTYTTTFAADERIFVVFLLDAAAEVEVSWSRQGKEMRQESQQVPAGQWAEGHIIPPSGGFEPGKWEVVLEIVGGDDRKVLTFTVTD